MPDHSPIPAGPAEGRFDVIIIGAGPAGLCGALGLARLGLRIGLLERQPRGALAAPAFDGREIALTHRSIALLQGLGVWQRIDPAQVAPLRNASVMDCGSRRRLFFDHRDGHCEALGQLVPNHVIRTAAYEAVAAEPRVALLCGRHVSALQTAPTAVTVGMAQGETLSAQLLVGADSRFSDTRRSVGIAADMIDFGKSMLVCRMQHQESHAETAWEWFQEKCTVALLPLRGHESSAVITVANGEALRLLSMDEQQFNRDIEARFERRLGPMQLTSTRHVYPLVATWSQRFVAARCALIGDAAVGMHPVTAHGFNLGLLSQELLVRELARDLRSGADIGAPGALSRYEAAHRRQTRLLYHGTNAIVRLYTDARPMHRLARTVGLRLAERITPFKRRVMGSLTQTAALPR
jgi:ubiquinone biosynthesis UbiH/UbiF/VisC/COQ6 family hydroxylase